ncbi:unnamed protein product [Caenorhabditis nigoni]
MEPKEYHIGKTVPEMIAVLEEHQEYCIRSSERIIFVHIAKTVGEIDNKYNEMDKDQKIEKYKFISYCAQRFLNPDPIKNFRTMPYEELIEHYNTRMYNCDVWKQYEAKKAAESIDAKKTSAKRIMDWTPFQGMGNRVKTAVTGLFESMKKRIGKKNKDEKE